MKNKQNFRFLKEKKKFNRKKKKKTTTNQEIIRLISNFKRIGMSLGKKNTNKREVSSLSLESLGRKDIRMQIESKERFDDII